jgi:hypothetical protein
MHRESLTSKSLLQDMRDLFWQGGFSSEYQARPILMRIYSAIFCFSITMPERPYILFQFNKPLDISKSHSDPV